MRTTLVAASRCLTAAAAMLALTCASFVAHAANEAEDPGQNVISGIDVTSAAGGKVIVKITTRDPLAAPPVGFAISNPPRVAFDFPNTVNGIGKSNKEVGNTELRSIRLGQSGGL